jgi:hypothetical protein
MWTTMIGAKSLMVEDGGRGPTSHAVVMIHGMDTLAALIGGLRGD